MTTMSALTVKKYDGTTDITYAVLTKSGGDGSWAIWRQDAGNTFPYSARPTLKHRVVESSKGVRRVDIVYTYPFAYTDTNTGQAIIDPRSVSFKNGTWTVPQGLPAALIQEASAQFCNLMHHADVKSGFVDQTAFV